MASTIPSDAIQPHHDDDDEADVDSLFGSPPPSPSATGRSPSPLALPSGSCSTQNVGTLALPGSHLFSELPSAQPLPLAGPPNSTRTQSLPPLISPSSEVSTTPSIPPRSATPASFRQPKTISTTRPKPQITKRPSQRIRSTSKPTAPPRPAPPIQLPDPSGAPPSNFLRNQQALLGFAGVISGINPANLALPQHARGSTPSNPIVIEDDPSLSRQSLLQPIDPANLPTPSPDDIVKTLIKQKNIFPLIDALLRLVSSRSAPAPPQPELTAFQRPSTKGPLPASKKRKLSSVPAGATDWDVPYPFATGQGPSDYRTNWERERGKQLIDDLITLVKTAATKAATKNYYKEKHLPRKAGNGLSHYSEQVLRTAGLHLQKSSSTCSTPGPSIAGSGSTSPSPAPSDFSSFDWTSGQNQYDPFGGSQAMGSSSSCMPYPSPSGSSTPLSSIANWTEGSSPELDDFLALLDGLPQGDLADMFDMPGLDEGEGSQVLGDVQDEQKDKEKEKGKEEGSVGEGEGVVLDPTIFETDPSLLAIDPTLLAFSFPPPPPPPSTPNNEASGVGSSVQSQAKGGTGCVTASTTGFTNTTMKTTRTTKSMTNSTTSSRSGSGTPLTPTLVASPLSLVFDQEHEREPLTPVGSVWDFSGGGEEPEIVCGGNGNGMDVDGSDFDEGKCIKSQKGRGRSTGASVLAGMDLRKKVLTRRAWLAVSGLEGCAGEETVYGRKDKGKKRARDDDDDYDDNEDSGITPEVNERREIGMRGEEVQGRVFPRPTGSMPPLFVASTTPATPAPAYTHSGYTYPHPHPYTHPSVSFHPTPSFPTPTPTLTPSPSSTSTSTSPSNSNPTPSLRKPDKLSIIQRAREVRGKLEEEIRKARVELWECAMEGGCLVLVGKDKGGGVKSKGFGR